MKPYYEQDGITLYLGDCREVLPQITEKVDLVLTDPPYNAKNIGPNERVYSSGVMQLPQEEYVKFCQDWFTRVPSQRIVFTPGISNICYYPQPHWILCWHKPAAVSFNRMGGYNAWEPISVYGKIPKGKRLGQDYILCNTLNFTKGEERNHPCPKPMELIAILVDKFSVEDEIICDPFLGSGTTAVAAKKLGRRCIGIEINEDYLKIAIERLRQSVMNLTV